MILELPDEIFAHKLYSEQELRADIAVMLYQRRQITLARAARWVGLSRLDFQKVLADKKVSINFSIADFKVDLQSLQAMPE